MKKLTLFLVVAIFLFSFSCEKKPITPIIQKPTFTIYGVVVKDMNISKDIASFTVLRNDTLYNGATVKAGNKIIPNSGSGAYYQEFSDTTFHRNTAYIDSIVSPNDTMIITFNFTMPDTFSIDSLPLPEGHLNPGGLSVHVTWTVPANADGYIVSVTKGDTISGALLYRATMPEPQTVIPTEAFHTDGMSNLVTGDYWIYVIAYKKSFVSYPGIPFQLPQGLPANNIASAKGTIGAGVIARKAIITVPSGQ